MKLLRIFLGLIYPTLIILLLLSTPRSCNNPTGNSHTPPDPTEPSPVPVRDSADVVRQAEQTGSSGALKVTLIWNFWGDIDLHVKQPNGTEIYYENKKDNSSGGFLDVDNVDGGRGAAENVYWENPPKGMYSISLDYFQPSQSMSIAESGTCTVVVFLEGKTPQTYKVEMNKVKDKKNIVNITI